MGINSTDTAYNFGQLGSAFNDGTAAMTPPTGKVFVAITMVTASKFDTSEGLVAENDTGNGIEYIGTDTAAHDAGSASATSGSGGVVVDVSNVFPAGLTIYGRWTKINPGASSQIIAYIGN